MSNNKLVGHYNDVKPIYNDNLVKTGLCELITPKSHGTDYSFNIIKLQPGGLVKEQSHAEEHAVFILSGTCRILLGEEWVRVQQGNFLHIPANLKHSFSNDEAVPANVLILKK